MIHKYINRKFAYFIFKGYRVFKKNNFLENYYQAELDIEDHVSSLRINNSNLLNNKKFIFNQFFVRFLLSRRLKVTYLFFLGLGYNLIIPAPLQWLKILRKNNIRVNVSFSIISFFFLFLIFLLRSVILLLFYLFKNYKSKIQSNNYDVLVNITSSDYLPHNLNKNLNIVEYITKEFAVDNDIYHRIENYNSEYSMNKIFFTENFFPIKFLDKLNVFIEILKNFSISLIKLTTLNYYNIFLFKETIEYYQVKKFHKKNNLAKNYFFILNETAFRPLWSYYAESKGSNIVFINYASGFYGLKDIKNNNYPLQVGLGLKCMTWPKYVVDKKNYFNFLNETYPDQSFYLSSSPIDINDCGAILPHFDKNKFTIGLFDVTPIRKFRRMLLLPQDNFRTSELCIKFLSDLSEIKDKLKLQILYKKKRSNIKGVVCKRYSNFVNTTSFINVDSCISAARVAANCDLLICTPFTTAAFNPNRQGYINTIFYSPLNLVDRYDRATQSLQVIIGKSELEECILKKLNNYHQNLLD